MNRAHSRAWPQPGRDARRRALHVCAKAFWSATLYDSRKGLFIPNEYHKYSVGENGGLKLDASGGVEIHIAAERPDGVPAENWLPSGGKDEQLDVIMRIYAPDIEAMKTWTAPKAELVR